MTLRPIRRADTEALRALWNRAAVHDPLSAPLFDEKVWDDPGFTPDLALAADAAGEIAGFAFGVVRPSDDGPRGVIKLLAVAPERQREGIGTRLVEALETAMQAAGATAIRLGESPPNYLSPGLDPRYTRALLLFEKRGYTRLREAYHMAADLAGQTFDTDADEQALTADGITVRRAAGSDQETVMTFLDEHWPPWKAEIGRTFANDPVSLHLAFEGGAVLGFSAYDANNVGTGWFGPMGTAPAARGRGVGAVLLKRCLADMKAQGHATSTIPWVAPIAFYAHHVGAEISRLFYRYEKKLGG
ncbi:MAG: GNAT family N-acetyltransferase [Rhodothermales bacterium]